MLEASCHTKNSLLKLLLEVALDELAKGFIIVSQPRQTCSIGRWM